MILESKKLYHLTILLSLTIITLSAIIMIDSIESVHLANDSAKIFVEEKTHDDDQKEKTAERQAVDGNHGEYALTEDEQDLIKKSLDKQPLTMVVKRIPISSAEGYITVLHECEGVLMKDPIFEQSPIICLGKNRLSMMQNNSWTSLREFEVETIWDVELLHRVRLLQDSEGNEKLFITMRDDNCYGYYGLCGFTYSLSLVIDMEPFKISQLKKASTRYSQNYQLTWNDELSKAVGITGCPEGCPDLFVFIYDLVKDEYTSFLKRGDEKLTETLGRTPMIASPEDVEWQDENTFTLMGVSYNL